MFSTFCHLYEQPFTIPQKESRFNIYLVFRFCYMWKM